MTHDYEVKVRLEEKDYARLSKEAKATGIPVAVLARSWIKEHLSAPTTSPATTKA